MFHLDGVLVEVDLDKVWFGFGIYREVFSQAFQELIIFPSDFWWLSVKIDQANSLWSVYSFS